MRKFGKLVSMFIWYPVVLKPVLYINSWLRGINPHKHIIDIEVTYTPK